MKISPLIKKLLEDKLAPEPIAPEQASVQQEASPVGFFGKIMQEIVYDQHEKDKRNQDN